MLDNQLILNDWEMRDRTINVDVTLPAGERAIQVEFYENAGIARVAFWWELAPTDTPTPTPTVEAEPTATETPTAAFTPEPQEPEPTATEMPTATFTPEPQEPEPTATETPTPTLDTSGPEVPVTETPTATPNTGGTAKSPLLKRQQRRQILSLDSNGGGPGRGTQILGYSGHAGR